MFANKGIQFGMSMQSMSQLTGGLLELSRTKSRAIMRRGLAAAITPVNAAVKRIVKTTASDSGLTAKSIGKKVTTSRRTGDSIGLVGARRGFEQIITVRRYGRLVKVKKVPTRYFHLVDKGTSPHDIKINTRYGVRIIHHPGAKPRHVLNQGFNDARSQMNQIFESHTEASLRREADKMSSAARKTR